MTGKHTRHDVTRGDDAFLAQSLRPGNAGRRRRLTAEAAGTDLRLGVEDVLVGHLADHAAAALQRTQRLEQVDRPVDLDGAGDGRGPYLVGVESAIVRLAQLRLGTPAVPA